jgi:hypothetical protein
MERTREHSWVWRRPVEESTLKPSTSCECATARSPSIGVWRIFSPLCSSSAPGPPRQKRKPLAAFSRTMIPCENRSPARAELAITGQAPTLAAANSRFFGARESLVCSFTGPQSGCDRKCFYRDVDLSSMITGGVGARATRVACKSAVENFTNCGRPLAPSTP